MKKSIIITVTVVILVCAGLIFGDIVPLGTKVVSNPCSGICDACNVGGPPAKLHYRNSSERQQYSTASNGCSNQTFTYKLYW